MEIKTIILAGVAVFTVAGCTDYILPERAQVDPSTNFATRPHPNSAGQIESLVALIEARNEERRAAGLEPLTNDQAVQEILRAREQGEEAPGPGFFSRRLSDAPATTPARPVSQTELATAAALATAPAEDQGMPLGFAGDGLSGPANPIPGQCYALATQPAAFETVVERVVTTPASEEIIVTPAQLRTETAPVVVEEAYTRIEVVPAVYETVLDTVVVEPAREETVTIPATFRTVVDRVETRPAFREWVSSDRIYPTGGVALGGTVVGNRTSVAGDLEALVEFPAEFDEVSRQELVTPERTTTRLIPAITREVPRRVVVQPATTREVIVPAVIDTVEREVVAVEERIERRPVPATFRNVERQTALRPARQIWTAVVCDTEQDSAFVRQVQSALRARGLYRGQIDGVSGPGTRRAIRAFQLDNGLDSSVLTTEGAALLGITY